MKPIESVYKLFGLKVEQIRLAIGVTQDALGKSVGLTRTSINNIERGRQRILLADVERFANALHTSPKHLMRGIWT